MFCRYRLFAILVVTLIPLAGCGAASTAISPLSTPVPDVSGGPPPTLHDIAASPDMYVGQQVAVEGTLEAEGQMPSLRFFLSDGNERLEVTSWAPLETIQPPQGQAQPKSMANYVNRRLRLTGILKRGSEGLLLEVAVAEELP